MIRAATTPATTAIPAEVLRAARDAARLSGLALIDELAGPLNASPRDALAMLAATFHMPLTEMASMQAWAVASDLLPLGHAMRRGCLLFRDAGQLIGVIADPFDTDAQQWLASLSSSAIAFRLTTPGNIQAYISHAEGHTRAIETTTVSRTATVAEATHNETARTDVEHLSLQSISAGGSPVVRLVNSTLYDALKAGASDIHLECSPTGMVLRFRIDGVLDTVNTVTGIETTEQVISRIKVMAELDIAERRVPQDGRFRVNINHRDVDIRVSIMPSVHGEDAVLRVLDKRTFLKDDNTLRLDLLGFDADSLTRIRRLTHEPYGMLLVTGPTGSGKTTTLYAAISEINHGHDKIVTIEDPVEYELPGVLQIPVNEKKGLTFARGLRSILRHDPDKIMVGEIRDRETAEIAVQSALTGHLVLTTVHANNVFDVFSRFTHLGIDPYALTAALNGIWAQRLVRLVCPHCAIEHQPTAEELANHRLSLAETTDFRFRIGRGCSECRGSGYRGRKAIAEILSLNDRLREMVATRQAVTAIKDEARKNGTRYLRESALTLVAQGETTLEEIGRVTLSA
jgi:general secretion pathway protein E